MQWQNETHTGDSKIRIEVTESSPGQIWEASAGCRGKEKRTKNDERDSDKCGGQEMALPTKIMFLEKRN